MDSRFFPFLSTTLQRDILREELDLLAKGFFSTDSSHIKKILQEKVRSKVATLLEELISRENAPELLQELLSQVNNLAVLPITLAFEPTEEQIHLFAKKISEGKKEPILLEVEYDPKIIGGAVLISNGKLLDYSLKRSIQEIFETDGKKIIQSL